MSKWGDLFAAHTGGATDAKDAETHVEREERAGTFAYNSFSASVASVAPASWGEKERWRDRFEERAAHRQYDGHRSRAEAEALAWVEMQNIWHLECGVRVPRDLCAGCRQPIGDAAALDLLDGSRVHLTDGQECLIRHGGRWRAAAAAALVALGLTMPASPPEPGDQ